MSVLVEFSMSPMDKGTSVSDYVARSLDIVSQSGLAYRLGPMGTCVEGDWKDVMGVIEKCYRSMSEECERISCYIKVDARAGETGRINSKIAKVEEILGRKLDQ
ncbi:MAG TPA: MTH1187 family thiamine-binding protein [Phycisphaerae bacterium]|nr:MTH1187 family thiamine-binding protein [Phycisphaerae bacterium]HRW51342.1 MTH1187 family thiamine-binding protein [Phycisphaerae bacterium]